LSDNDVDPTIEFGDQIQTFNYAPLVKVIPSDGIPRIVEDEDAEDSNTDSLKERNSDGYLKYIHSDVSGENENIIAKK
jgi:hypothetical protein